MADHTQSPLVELRELEERLAVRTARIDQLHAATRSSDLRTVRFARTLIAIGTVSALITAIFDLRQTDPWTLDILLALAAVALTSITGLFSLFAKRLTSGNDKSTTQPRIFTWCVKASPSWQPFAMRLPQDQPDATTDRPWRTSTWLFVPAAIAAAAAAVVGGVALAVFALLLVSGLLRLIWSRQASVPYPVHLLALIVAIVAAMSLGSWVGGLSHGTLRIYDGRTQTMRLNGDKPARTDNPTVSSQTAHTMPPYQSTCPTPTAASSTTSSLALRQLRDAWDEVGTVDTGCPGPVYSASRYRELVASDGHLGGALKSLGVADSDRAIVLFGQPAIVVHKLLSGKNLQNVPTHLLVGGGDFYLINTTTGTFVLVRKTPPYSETEEPTGTNQSGEDYVVLSPSAATAWLAAMRETRGWLWPAVSTKLGAKRQTFVFVTTHSAAVARASCNPPNGPCELSTGSSRYQFNADQAELLPDELLSYAPSP